MLAACQARSHSNSCKAAGKSRAFCRRYEGSVRKTAAGQFFQWTGRKPERSPFSVIIQRSQLPLPFAMSPEQVAELIRAGLPGADVRVESEDHTHFAARIVAREFEG